MAERSVITTVCALSEIARLLEAAHDASLALEIAPMTPRPGSTPCLKP
jgi:hypothetical protein